MEWIVVCENTKTSEPETEVLSEESLPSLALAPILGALRMLMRIHPDYIGVATVAGMCYTTILA